MKTRTWLCIPTVLVLGSLACGATLTFDDVPSGTVLRGSAYAYTHRIWPSSDLQAIDHTASPWGHPYSGSNVLVSTGSFPPSIIGFGYFTTYSADWDHLQSLSAYFSTAPGAMIKITAVHWVGPGGVPVGSTVIGGLGESWDNRYVEIRPSSPQYSFEEIVIESVNSPSDLTGFCADDMTITLVPEPSSLLALAGGLVALGLPVIRRKWRQG